MGERILAMHNKYNPPEGARAEVIGGTMVISPATSRRRALVHARLHRQLCTIAPAESAVVNGITLDMIATGERYVPDLLVVREDALNSDEWLLEAKAAELVAEIVVPANARHVDRLRGYAASGVPIYLLVDPLERAVTLFTEPADGWYLGVHRVAFGPELPLPAPCAGSLDTSVFA